MIPPRSFRGRLALRISGAVMALTLVGSAVGYLAIRRILLQRLDATLLRLAGIEAAAAADSPDESVHFHDEVLWAFGPGHETVLSRYAEVWTLDGGQVVRTRNLEGRDLPLSVAVRERVVQSGEPELFHIDWEGSLYRAVLFPLGIIGPQHRLHLLQVAVSTTETEGVLRRVLALLGALVVIGSAVGGWLSWWLAGYAVRPVLEITHQAEELEANRPGHHITAHAETEELNRLVSVLNAMLARIDTALDSQRRFLADAGHAIKTPLTILRGDVDVALRRPRSPEEYERVLHQTRSDLREVSVLAEDLITLARSDSGVLTPGRHSVSVDLLLARVAGKFERIVRDTGAQLVIEAPPELVVEGESALLERAVSNLVDNAIKYGRNGGRVILSADARSDDWVQIRVADNGPGIPLKEQGRLFERFYRGEPGRRAARGSGLGLAIVKAIIESLGGKVEMASAPGQGTTITLLCRRPPSPA